MSLASSVAPPVGPATPRVGVTSHPWVRFGVRRLGAAAGVPVGPGHRVVPDDPPDPRRPGARRARPDGAGRAGRRQARGAGARRPAAGAVLALPPGPVHRRPRHLAGLAAAGLRRSSSQRLPATLALALLAFVVAVAGRGPARRRDGRADPARPRPAHRAGLHHRPAWSSAPSPTSWSASGSSTSSASTSAGSRSPATTRPSAYVLPGPLAGDRPGRDPGPHRPRRDGDGARGRLRAHRPRQAAADAPRSTSATPCRTRSPRRSPWAG